MFKYAVLGAGMMGRVLVKELLDVTPDSQVLLTDIDSRQLEAAAKFIANDRLRIQKLDISNLSQAVNVLENHDMIISALPHSLSLAGIQAALHSRVSLVDLVGEAPEKRAELDAEARNLGILIIPGLGVAPGISNICVGQGVELLDETHNALIYVGGIPRDKKPPFYYQTVYLLESVFNAYLQPADVILGGKRIFTDALSGLERIDFPSPIGSLEAFFTDGLASLHLTVGPKIKNNLFEKTLRYPGHVKSIQFLKQCGLLAKNPIVVNNQEVIPFEFTHKLLEPLFKLGQDGDILVMRVIVEGIKEAEPYKHIFELVDYFDPHTQYTAMARTTCFPAVCAAHMLASGELKEKGVLFPEQLFIGHRFDKLISELASKGVRVNHRVVP